MVNAFLAKLNSSVGAGCPFCGRRETVFHCFWECGRLTKLFVLLRAVFRESHCFLLGVRSSRQTKRRAELLNFLLGQAKMAVYMSRRRQVEGRGSNLSSCSSGRSRLASCWSLGLPDKQGTGGV